MTTVDVFRSGSYESVDFASFEIEMGISPLLVAPRATVRISPRESITAGQDVRIQIDGDTKFEGSAESGGTKRESAPMKVPLRHDAAELFSTKASITETGPPTDETVLSSAISSAGTQASFTLNYVGSATTLANDYSVENRPVVNIFRDMMDRTGRIWWVDPDTNTITVDTEGGRGSWQSLDANTDRFAVESFDTGSVETVRNDVTVIGTGEEKVVGTATDATSQSNYGKRSVTVNVEYAITQSEADAIASSLIQADPVAEGELRVGRNVGAIEDPQINKTVDLTDSAKDISATGLVVEKQRIEQGTATLSVGGGVGESVSEHNRTAKSDGDVTEPGTVINTDRLADDSVDTAQLVNTAVIEDKLADLSVSETKVQDDSIATPKLQAEAVTSNEILAGTIQAVDIAAGTITANEIDTLDLDTGQLSVVDPNDSTNGLEMVLDSNGVASILPVTNENARLGEIGGPRFLGVASLLLQADTIIGAADAPNGQVRIENASDVHSVLPQIDETGQVGSSSEAWADIHAYNITGHGGQSGIPKIIPDTDVTGSVGEFASAWDSMRAASFVTDSPEPIAAKDREAHSDETPDHVDGEPEIDLAELADVSWYDPPGYVAREQRERAQGDGDGNEDDHGVDIGTMANYLLEVNKRQQERIDDLEARIAALEDPNA